jgi:hypothetical protein
VASPRSRCAWTESGQYRHPSNEARSECRLGLIGGVGAEAFDLISWCVETQPQSKHLCVVVERRAGRSATPAVEAACRLREFDWENDRRLSLIANSHEHVR